LPFHVRNPRGAEEHGQRRAILAKEAGLDGFQLAAFLELAGKPDRDGSAIRRDEDFFEAPAHEFVPTETEPGKLRSVLTHDIAIAVDREVTTGCTVVESVQLVFYLPEVLARHAVV
jgi:hypothetical protein